MSDKPGYGKKGVLSKDQNILEKVEEGKQHYFEFRLPNNIDELAKDTPQKTIYSKKRGKLLGTFLIGKNKYEYFLTKEDGKPEVVRKRSWNSNDVCHTVFEYNSIAEKYISTAYGPEGTIDEYLNRKKEFIINEIKGKEDIPEGKLAEEQFFLEGFAIAALEDGDLGIAIKALKIAEIEKLDRVIEMLWKFKKESGSQVEIAEYLLREDINI